MTPFPKTKSVWLCGGKVQNDLRQFNILEKLKFSNSNAKLGKEIYSFSLPSGFSCPGALDCLSKANPDTGVISDGPHTEFRCFSASMEAVFPSLRKARWFNFQLLSKFSKHQDMAKLILDSIPDKASIIRVHVGGDFFNMEYFRAWMLVASKRKDLLFYAYTKSIQYWVMLQDIVPDNFKLVASYGSRYDALIEEHCLRYAKVVYSEEEAEELGLQIDHDDSTAYKTEDSFCFLLHGQQPKGSKASKAISVMKAAGVQYSYPSNRSRSLETVTGGVS